MSLGKVKTAIYTHSTAIVRFAFRFRFREGDSCDIKTTQIHYKRHKENLERILPRPKSGEFRALFEGGTPWAVSEHRQQTD